MAISENLGDLLAVEQALSGASASVRLDSYPGANSLVALERMPGPDHRSRDRHWISIWLLAGSYALMGMLLYPLCFLILGKVGGTILFYRGILYAVAVWVVQFAAMRFITGRTNAIPPRMGPIRGLFHFAVCCMSLSFNLTFLIVFPVTFDRSVTTYLLEELDHQGAMTPQEMENALIREYVTGAKAVPRRIQEQSISGTVRFDLGRVTLTPGGRSFVSFGRAIRAIYGSSDRSVPE
jgi:hypothetical protein